MSFQLRQPRTWTRRLALGAVASAALLAGCGGGDSVQLPKITSVKVMGDSLADVGTFGIKFTVQGTATAPEPIYPEIIAASYGLTQHCNFYTFTGTTFAANTAKTGCTNFAIGGGRINGATSGFTAADPRNIGVQLATAVAGGNHTANDLLVIDGGGNDAADIVGLYLGAATGGAAAVAAYGTALKTLLPAATVDASVGTLAGRQDLGGKYMTALADLFYSQIKTNALDKGAKYVVLINMPAITNTPRFQLVLDSIAASSGGGTTGAAARSASEALFKSWVVAFNTQLAGKVAGNTSVLPIDLYALFNNEIASPATYGFTNVVNTACPATGVGTDGLPTYNFATCTSTALSALTPPTSSTGGSNWWRTYLFSDGFHPTPLGHQIAGSTIRTALFNNSWQ